jgi:hypothetical protein
MMTLKTGKRKWMSFCGMGIFLFVSQEVWAADWKLLVNQSNDSYFFDADSIKNLDNKNIRVWGKEILSEERKSRIKKNLGDDLKNLHSASIFFEINCREKMIRPLMIEYYSHDGFIISTDSYDGEWEIVIPGQTQDVLRENVCK